MEKSSKGIEAIIKEKIGIFGDYDVDGATSTALLGNYFSELNIDYEIYIRDEKEGYGPSIKSFQKLIDKKVDYFHCRLWHFIIWSINFAKKKCGCYCIRSPSIRS